MTTTADRILIIAAACLLGFLYWALWFDEPRGVASSVRVLSGNETVAELSLTENTQLNVPGPLGDSVVEINNGRVRFRRSPCRNQVCVHSGWQSRAGQVTACLPNRVALALSGQGRFDSLNY